MFGVGPIPTTTLTHTHTATVTATMTATTQASPSYTPIPQHNHQPFMLGPTPPPPGYTALGYSNIMPPLAGSLVTAPTAILCLFFIAGIYWAFKNLGVWGGGGGDTPPPATTATATPDPAALNSKSKSSPSSSDPAPAVSVPAIPLITPTAYASLVFFVLVAAIMIQGPLGLGQAFEGTDPLSGSQIMEITRKLAKDGRGMFGRLEGLGVPGIIGAQAQPTYQPAYQQPLPQPPAPQMGGQGSSSGPQGASQWNWFANPLPPLNGQAPQQQQQPVGRKSQFSATNPQALAFSTLPPFLQENAFCQSEPVVCSTLLGNADLSEIGRLLGGVSPNLLRAALAQLPVVQPTPVPLVPARGFAGSYVGVQNIENSFYPLLIGAIALVILFDYGT